MLVNLTIQNLLLLEKVSIDFNHGLCVLTGETGAGKSILLDALMFVLGEKANAKMIRSGSDYASVTAEFNVSAQPEIQQILSSYSLPFDETLLVRRVIELNGKSKNFINDVPVSVAIIKQIANSLVEIHGQFDQKGLLEPATHRDVIDKYGRLEGQVAIVKQSYEAWQHAQSELLSLKDEVEKIAREEEYLRYVAEELKKLAPVEGEELELAEKRALLMNKEKVIDLINSTLGDLNNPQLQGAINSAIRDIIRSSVAEEFTFASDALDRALIEIREAVNFLEHKASELNVKDNNLEQIEERLFSLRAAARKYHTSVDGLAAYQMSVNQSLSLLQQQEHNQSELEEKVRGFKEKYFASASKLSEMRKKVAVSLEKALTKELAPLKMEKTIFKVNFEPLLENNCSAYGIDKVTFMASTNPGIPLAPLAKIASGGELSRFMLAAKLVLSDIKSVPTMIFDEIDTGIGGATADAVGSRLHMLGKKVQVIVVTHQPQVAAKGSLHLFVAKQQRGSSTITVVKSLSNNERQEELARMLSGEQITDQARAAANQLLLSI